MNSAGLSPKAVHATTIGLAIDVPSSITATFHVQAKIRYNVARKEILLTECWYNVIKQLRGTCEKQSGVEVKALSNRPYGWWGRQNVANCDLVKAVLYFNLD